VVPEDLAMQVDEATRHLDSRGLVGRLQDEEAADSDAPQSQAAHSGSTCALIALGAPAVSTWGLPRVRGRLTFFSERAEPWP
jgi:hypothetical protein